MSWLSFQEEYNRNNGVSHNKSLLGPKFGTGSRFIVTPYTLLVDAFNKQLLSVSEYFTEKGLTSITGGNTADYTTKLV